MSNIDEVIDILSKNKVIRSYTDKEGKFHITTKTEEQERKEKEKKLTYEKGLICSICGKRRKDFRYDINNDITCSKCYDKTWEEYSVREEDITINIRCPVCENKLTIPFESHNTCKCGAIYKSGFEDEFYYTVDFYMRKNRKE
ncbi:unnamed protein product [marine sediment metagenome]|uniref:Uncharacterized protein n=1 Tax=marine sediment metagenome TaxID=412755 RepID=X1BE35_9ZZZZ